MRRASLLAAWAPFAWARRAAPRPGARDVDVYTPGVNDNGKRPVMVWLHGGGFAQGAASSVVYNGANLAKRGDVVVVGVNHRLNIFGYCFLGDLGGAEFADSGNAGMLDIVQ